MHSKVIDVHSHLYLARAEGGGLKISPPEPNVPIWTVESTLSMMDQNNIGVSLLSQPQKATWHQSRVARKINEDFARIVYAHPQRFGSFAVLPLGDIDATLAEIEYSLDQLKLDGILLNTNVEGVYLGEPRFEPIWAELDRRGAVAFVHPTVPPHFDVIGMGYQVSIIEYAFESTRSIASLVYSGTKRKYPNVKIISTHGGGVTPFLAWRLAYLPQHFGMEHVDPSIIMSELKGFYFDLTASATPYALPSILGLVPTSQILMGFDYPMMTVPTFLPAQTEVANHKGLTELEVNSIFSGNAMALFPRLST
jgi:aminocarboxymuconate-semialdehyde decarboxylase